MYTVEFYENDRGVSELWDFLEELRIKSASNKDARIQYKQIVLYIPLLQDNGTRLSENVTKHLMDGIWELRPGNNRVFYFCWRGDRFVLLHQFRKRSQKHRGVKLNEQKRNVMIGLQERVNEYEDLERL